jgi:hypothetical protein
MHWRSMALDALIRRGMDSHGLARESKFVLICIRSMRTPYCTIMHLTADPLNVSLNPLRVT